jgi:hypothetical protein
MYKHLDFMIYALVFEKDEQTNHNNKDEKSG